MLFGVKFASETLLSVANAYFDYCTHLWDKMPLEMALLSPPQSFLLQFQANDYVLETKAMVALLDLGDKKCDHYGGSNHTEPYYWVKYGKADDVHQVIDGIVQPQPTSTPWQACTSWLLIRHFFSLITQGTFQKKSPLDLSLAS